MDPRKESTQSNNLIQNSNRSAISASHQLSSPPSFFQPTLPQKSFLGVTLKPGIPLTAFFNYLLAFFITIEALTLFSTSGFFLIKSPYYGIQDPRKAQQYLTDITFYNQIYSIIMLPITGLFHDYFGRRIMFVTGALICAVALFIIPILGQVYPWLLIARFLLQQGIIHLLTNPLAADYVVDEKKGLASAYAGIASGLGAILSALGLLGMGRLAGWGSVFYLSGALALLSSFYMFFFVVNVKYQQDGGRCPLIPGEQKLSDGSSEIHLPSTMSNKIQKSIQSYDDRQKNCARKVLDKIATAGKQSWNSVIITSYIGSFAIRACDILMTVFLISYVTFGIYAKDTHYPPDYEKNQALAEKVSHTMSGVGSVVGLVLAVIFGFLSDKIGFAITNIIAYSTAGLCYAIVTYVNNDDVQSDSTYALMILGAGFVTAGIVVVSILCFYESQFTQNNMMINRVLRKDAKGIILSIFVFFGSCGVLFQTKVGDTLIEEGYTGGAFPLGAGLCFFTSLLTLLLWAGKCFAKDVERAKSVQE